MRIPELLFIFVLWVLCEEGELEGESRGVQIGQHGQFGVHIEEDI